MCLLVVNQVAHGILESGIIQLESGICHHFLSFLKKNEVSGGKLFKFSADSYPYLKARMLVFTVFLHACQYISKTSS
jgi:hypothetical protein